MGGMTLFLIALLYMYMYIRLILLSGETDDLRRFSLDFNFPTPGRAVEPEADVVPDLQDDGFVLDTTLPPADDYALPAPDHDAGPSLRDFESTALPPDQLSDTVPAGFIGGGLREDLAVADRKQKKLSRHGIPVPLLPSGVVKRLATRFARTSAGSKAKISKDTLAAIELASAYFFEQAAQDLATYAGHAGRKTMDEHDVVTLMRRCVAAVPTYHRY
jgi:histone H3/H4